LEFRQVLELLAEEAASVPGKSAVRAISPTLSPKEILASWALIGETRGVLDTTDAPDLRDHLDLQELLARLAPEGARLDPAELALVGLEAQTSTLARRWAIEAAEAAPLLAEAAADLADFSELTRVLAQTLGPDGEILDSASVRLARLRQELSSSRQALTARLGELMRSESYRPILMDELVTTRNDRFVVPVRASAAGKKRGLVHDWSKSGATAYLEPLETVEDNNRLAMVKREEKKEIERILLKISADCRALAPDFMRAGACLTRLDAVFAQARLSRALRSWAPEWAPGQGVHLVRARHPLLEKRLSLAGRSMVPLDIDLHPDKPLAVVSGMNAGGKTVALRTLGLIMVMAAAGLPLPVAEGSRIDFPKDVVTVMGDSQDLDNDLSTFSGHVKALAEVLDAAGPGTLAIIDELGSGTDPAEGAALGLAVLERLRASGALVIAATHFHLIKSWAALADDVVSVSVNLSPVGRPVYGLSYGAPGFSGGLRMARVLGLDPGLVDRAEGYLDDGHRRAMEILERLDAERGALAAERERLEARLKALEKEGAEREEALRKRMEQVNKLSGEQAAAVKSQLAKNRIEFDALKEELKKAVKEGRQPDMVRINLERARQERELFAVKPEPSSLEADRPLQDVYEGALVKVKSLGLEGVVKIANHDRGEYVVEAGGLTVKLGRGELLEPGRRKPKKDSLALFTQSSAGSDAGLSLNLIGYTVDEAETALDKEIDRALLGGRDKLTIIHGVGSGRLKKGLWSHLKRHPMVKGFSSPENVPGGAGVTEVELR
jgi:DNA mismatch repair protein MutS2